jgi:GntR family transcriptional repressor for pyruvate dehydrogenase complex
MKPHDDVTDAAQLLRALPQRVASTRSESVAAEIEALILRGELADGQRLPPEPEMCEILGASRSVIRDAVRRLAARGLVDVRQGSGTVVSVPSDEPLADAIIALLMRSELTMGDVIEARAALETELASLAAEHGNDEDWDALEGHLAAFSAAVEESRWQDAYIEHMRFHVGIFDALHLPALGLILAPMQECVLITSLPPDQADKRVWEVEAHPPILAALRSGDREGAREAVAAHFGDMRSKRYQKFRATSFRAAAQLDEYRSFRDQHLDLREAAATIASKGESSS